MQGLQHEGLTALGPLISTEATVWLLASLASLYRRPFDADLLLKRFPPPLDMPALIKALETQGLKAGLVSRTETDVKSLPLPAVAFIASAAEVHGDGDSSSTAELIPALILKHGEQTRLCTSSCAKR
ncbi:MAG: hypothetical protein ACOZAI_10755 [Pseudomonadota bacterium]